MKNKKKTYLLLAGVICIWGLIIFQFAGAINPSSEEMEETTSEAIFVPAQTKERDLFALALTYRDPFLESVKVPRKKLANAKNPVAQKKVAPTKTIQYTGFIKQKNSKQLIFFVAVDGRQQMMKINDTFQEVKLVKGTKNSIKIKYSGKVESIDLSK